MKKGALRKVQRLEQFWVKYHTRDGVKRCGPYWRGLWWENRKQKRVYIGRELPRSMQKVMAGRYKRSGCKYYTWPGQAR